MRDLAADAVAGVQLVKGHSRIRADLVGVGGMSQGGWIAPMAAVLSEDVAFVVGFSAPGISPGEQNLFNDGNKLRVAGFGEDDVAEAARVVESVYAYLRDGEDRAGVEDLLAWSRSRPWYHASHEVRAWADRPLPNAPWEHLAALDLDPSEIWKTLRVPVVCVWGEEDALVPADLSERKIALWMEHAGNDEHLLLRVPGAGHDLRLPPEKPWSLGALPVVANAVPRFLTSLSCAADPPPSTKTVDASHELHGVRVPDPYRWLEGPGSPTREWAERQDARFSAAMAGYPRSSAYEARLLELNGFSRAAVPRVAGGRYFTGGKAPGENWSYIRVQTESERARGHPPRQIVDPHRHPAAPGESVALSQPVPSPDGRFVLFGASSATMRPCVRIVEVETGYDFEDEVLPVAYWPWTACWLPGGEAVAYAKDSRVLRHRLGTDLSEDDVLFEASDSPAPQLAVKAAGDGSSLFVTAFHPTDDTTKVYEIQAASGARLLTGSTPGRYQVVGKRGPRIYLFTTVGAPNGRVVVIDTTKDEGWTTVVPEYPEPIYDGNHPIRETVGLFADRLVTLHGHEGRLLLRVHDLDGRELHRIEHTEFGYNESGLVGHPVDPVVRYDSISMIQPGTAFEVNLHTGERHTIDQGDSPLESEDYTIERETYSAGDGTPIPIYLVHRRHLVRDGTHAVLLLNWAAMGLVVRPTALPWLQAWIERGGVVAIPAARGSGEYGSAWHAQGMGMRKAVSLDDLGAAAHWLARSGFSRFDRIAIIGSSSGSPSSAGAFLRHPHAFGAALIMIPRIDLLASHAWIEEYGDPDDPGEFRAMMEWLPLRNARPMYLPTALIQVGSVDPVAPPWHGYKLTAALQAAQLGTAPIYLQVAWGVGHALGNGIPHRCETQGKQLAFLARALGLEQE